MTDLLSQPVPEWLRWLTTAITLAMAFGAGAIWLWKKFLADRWAQRTRSAALKRATRLVDQYRHRWQLRQDVRALVGTSVSATAWFVLGAISLVAVIVFGTAPIQTSAIPKILFGHPIDVLWQLAPSGIFFGMGAFAFSKAFDELGDVEPNRNWLQYRHTLIYRLDRLLRRAEFDENKRQVFIQDSLDKAEEIKEPSRPLSRS